MVAGSRVATNCGVNTLSVHPATGGAAFSRYVKRTMPLIGPVFANGPEPTSSLARLMSAFRAKAIKLALRGAYPFRLALVSRRRILPDYGVVKKGPARPVALSRTSAFGP